MSPQYSLNNADLLAMLKVMAWSLSATIVTVLIAFADNIVIEPEYAFLLPVINSLLYGIKLFIEGRDV